MRDKSINNIVLKISPNYYLLTWFDYKMWLNTNGLDYLAVTDSWQTFSNEAQVKYFQQGDSYDFHPTIISSEMKRSKEKINKPKQEQQ